MPTFRAVTGSAARTHSQALNATTTSVSSLSRALTLARTLAATTTSVSGMTRAMAKTLAAVTTSVPGLVTVTSRARTLAAATVSMAVLGTQTSRFRILAATTVTAAAMQRAMRKTLAATTTSAAAMQRGIGIFLRATTRGATDLCFYVIKSLARIWLTLTPSLARIELTPPASSQAAILQTLAPSLARIVLGLTPSLASIQLELGAIVPYYVNVAQPVTIKVYNKSNVLADPTTLVADLTTPRDYHRQYAYGDGSGAITRQGVGLYTLTFTPESAEAGQWTIQVTATGNTCDTNARTVMDVSSP